MCLPAWQKWLLSVRLFTEVNEILSVRGANFFLFLSLSPAHSGTAWE